jgi:hypothetical protein
MPTKRKKAMKWDGDPLRPASERGETLFTRREAADYLSVRPKWLDGAEGRLVPRVKIGRYVRFRKANLDTYIESRFIPAGKR